MALVPSTNLTQLKEGLGRFASGFTRGQKAVTLAALAGVVIIIVVFMSFAGKPTYSILFSNLQGNDAASITQMLSGNHVPYQLEDGGATILVPENDVDQERLAAAQAGLPANSTVGLSLLDKEGLTTSPITQQADYLRALQGELQQTIDSIAGVESSQVNIAMAPTQTFVLGSSNPSGASVLVDLEPGHSLTYQQVDAITSLVSSSVQGLPASDVTVADSNGDLLAGPGASDNGAQQSGAETAYDDATAAKVMAYLTGVLGTGNADVQVNAQLDFDQVNTSTQTLLAGKNGKPITACTNTQSSSTNYTGNGTPPGSSVTGATGGGNYTETSTQATCEAASETQTVTEAPGSVKSQSVAVLVNEKAVPKGLSLAALQRGVAAAAGIETTRGDVLSFSQAAFPSETTTATPKTSMLTSYAKPGASLLLVLLVIVMLLLASRRARKRRAEQALLDQAGMERLFSMPYELTTEEVPAIGGPRDDTALVSLQSIVDNQPAEVAQVLSGWLANRQL